MLFWVFLETCFSIFVRKGPIFAKADQPASMMMLTPSGCEKENLLVVAIVSAPRIEESVRVVQLQGDELFTIWASPSSPSTEQRDRHRRP
jgi:hypothetical protein